MWTKRNNLLIIGFLILLFASYKLSISRTLELRQQFKSLTLTQEQIADLPNELQKLKRKSNYLDSLLNNYQNSDLDIQNQLFRDLNEIAKRYNVDIKNLDQPHIFQDTKMIYFTYRAKAEGDYKQLSNFLNNLEQTFTGGHILHLVYEKKKILRTGKYYLQLDLWLQKLTPIINQNRSLVKN